MSCVSNNRFIDRHFAARGMIGYVAAVVLGILLVATGVEAYINSVFEAPKKAAEPTAPSRQIQRTGGLVLTQDSWSEMLRDHAYWAGRKAGGSGNTGANGGSFWKTPSPPQFDRANLGIFAQPPRNPAKPDHDYSGGGDTFRTVCVRLCDGAFFPLSFATSREHFEQDAAKCEKSCGSASRMFFYKNPGAEPEDMEDLEGRPYKKLSTAFLYKTQYVEQCKCKPHPWEEAAVVRHQVYALEVAKAKGSKMADASLKDLKTKLQKAELEAQAEKKRLAQAKVDEQKRLAVAAKATKAAARSSGAVKPTVVAVGLPPPSTLEPTAMYQAPAAAGGTTTWPKPAPKLAVSTSPTAAIMRAGSSQAKSARTSTPPVAKSWMQGADSR